MEAFLSTLPPYVHEFLNQYPPTDVFNLLKELICFAVLYSDDRARINEATNEFLEKKKLLTTLEKADGSVLESTSARSHETIEEEEEEAEGKVKIDQETKKLDLQQNDERKQKTASLPSTFPDWWGHHEEELLPSQIRKEIKVANNNHSREIKKQQSVDLGWVSWDDPATSSVRRERARSQIIPNLRSYLEEDTHSTKPVEHQNIANRGTLSSKSSSPVSSKSKRHSMIDMKHSTSPTPINDEKVEVSSMKSSNMMPSTTSNLKRRSANVILNNTTAPTIAVAPRSKLLQQAKEKQETSKKTIAANSSKITPATTISTSTSLTPKSSSSVLLKQPRVNAAMRARAEHARLQKEEMERKKNQPPPGSSISMRLKQRANSGIDWESIKKERRKTAK